MSVKKNNAVRIDQSSALVKRVWSFCNVLRDEGVGASEYLEQITFLLFLKMADELDREMPAQWNWQILKTKTGTDLKDYYEKLLSALGNERAHAVVSSVYNAVAVYDENSFHSSSYHFVHFLKGVLFVHCGQFLPFVRFVMVE